MDHPAINLYIDLLEKSLLNAIYQDDNYNKVIRDHGLDWPKRAHTMIGAKRLDNVATCVKNAIKENIPGDLLEAGVWRGGCTILMRGILKAYGITNRTVWVADSFQGLPRPNDKVYPADRGLDLSVHPELSVSLEQVKENFSRYGLLDDHVKFIKGWFKDTLHKAPINKLAVLRLDGDLYESTIQTLEALYPKLSPGGYCIIDDYIFVPPCRRAVEDYRRKHNIQDTIIPIDQYGVYWKKGVINPHAPPLVLIPADFNWVEYYKHNPELRKLGYSYEIAFHHYITQGHKAGLRYK
jgi:O-methyltransferase